MHIIRLSKSSQLENEHSPFYEDSVPLQNAAKHLQLHHQPQTEKNPIKIEAFFHFCFLNMLSVLDFDLLQFLMPRNSTSSLEMVPPKPRSAIDVMWAPAKSACKSTVAGCDSFVSCRVNRSESRIKMRFGI